jgi:hypothetical protein
MKSGRTEPHDGTARAAISGSGVVELVRFVMMAMRNPADL